MNIDSMMWPFGTRSPLLQALEAVYFRHMGLMFFKLPHKVE